MLDKYQRLTLINQYRILGGLELEDADFVEKITDALTHGYQSEINDLFARNVYDAMPEKDCREVKDILDMYRKFHDSIESFTPDVAKAVNALGWVKFPGFDGNNESDQLAYVDFLMRLEGKWAELYNGEGVINSHMPTLDKYRLMLSRYEPLKSQRRLSDDDIKAIVAI